MSSSSDLIDPHEWADDPQRRTKRKNVQPEIVVQTAVVQYLRAVLPVGSIVAATNTEQRGKGRTAIERMRYGAARKKSGTLPGWFDIVCLLPSGKTLLIECKAGKNNLSDDQINVRDAATALLHRCGVVWSVDDTRELLQYHGISTRETQ